MTKFSWYAVFTTKFGETYTYTKGKCNSVRKFLITAFLPLEISSKVEYSISPQLTMSFLTRKTASLSTLFNIYVGGTNQSFKLLYRRIPG
jgi:hypothetical protein